MSELLSIASLCSCCEVFELACLPDVQCGLEVHGYTIVEELLYMDNLQDGVNNFEYLLDEEGGCHLVWLVIHLNI